MVKDGFQQTEIGIIPNDWTIKKIKEFTDATSGGTPSTFHSEYWNGKIRWMNSGEVNLKKIYEVKGRITELGLKNSSTKLIPKNCILIALAGQGKTRGTVAINYVELCINQSLGVILPNKSFSSEYVYHNLDSRYDELRSLSSGGEGRGGLNLTLIKNISIQFPPTIEEQNLIVKVLDCMDQIIEKLEKLIEKKKNIKQGAMQELLTGKRRLKGFTKKWNYDTIKNCAIITTGSRNTQDKINDGIYPFFVRSQKIERINSYSFDGEAVLTAGDGDIGKVFHYINEKFDFHQRVYCINNFNKKLDGYFFYIYFSNNFLKRVMSMTAKSTVDSVRMEMISEMTIPLPEKDEQIVISKILLDMDKEIQELEKQLNKYINLKQGMMQKLLTGEIKLK